jgi:ribosome assembly protein YihI (activator of Der GTPase)
MNVDRLFLELIDEVKNSHNTSYSLQKVADDLMEKYDDLMEQRAYEYEQQRKDEEDMRVPF